MIQNLKLSTLRKKNTGKKTLLNDGFYFDKNFEVLFPTIAFEQSLFC